MGGGGKSADGPTQKAKPRQFSFSNNQSEEEARSRWQSMFGTGNPSGLKLADMARAAKVAGIPFISARNFYDLPAYMTERMVFSNAEGSEGDVRRNLYAPIWGDPQKRNLDYGSAKDVVTRHGQPQSGDNNTQDALITQEKGIGRVLTETQKKKIGNTSWDIPWDTDWGGGGGWYT